MATMTPRREQARKAAMAKAIGRRSVFAMKAGPALPRHHHEMARRKAAMGRGSKHRPSGSPSGGQFF